MPDIPLLGADYTPDPAAAGMVFFAELPSAEANWSTGVSSQLLLAFKNGSTFDSVFGSFVWPDDYSSTPTIKVPWTSDTLTNDVRWRIDTRLLTANDVIDFTTWVDADKVTDVAPGTTGAKQVASITLTFTGGVPAAGDSVFFEFGRDGTDAADTLADVAYVIPNGLVMNYVST